MPELTVTVLKTMAEFEAMEPEWRELFAAAERPSTFQRHRWLRLSWELVWRRVPHRLRVVLVREDGVLVMAGAFVLTIHRLMPSVEFLSSGTPQCHDLLWCPSDRVPEHAHALLEALRAEMRLPRILRPSRLRKDSPLHAAVAAAGLRRRVRGTIPGAYVALRDYADYDAYLATLSKKLRSDHGRQLRRLGEMSLAVTRETGAGVGEALRWLFDVKRQWLVTKGQKAEWLSSGPHRPLHHRVSLRQR